ncbi:hypothetical protein EYZ11_004424 [Aspergillus tanneri]|uniref:Uncharacterized protein n=1 Tax=Aspergillus tanneri TaxID=1220188 RepID=A0A4S3JKW4_9EURO|nr:uncharacterized protein ATNIH1004_007731 [Aspergillus tanneri]KAA8646304.1 hypothetical protein ATNIH1004_007731 [Aspergillus tanneri]THC96102.1 hypothetical protein EYZ11_004424 [Aspergillus tanneri]
MADIESSRRSDVHEYQGPNEVVGVEEGRKIERSKFPNNGEIRRGKGESEEQAREMGSDRPQADGQRSQKRPQENSTQTNLEGRAKESNRLPPRRTRRELGG